MSDVYELPRNMIERVSRALAIEDGYDPDHEGDELGDEGYYLWMNYRKPAVAALSAMLKPTKEMLSDGYLASEPDSGLNLSDAWEFMIEAAIEGK